MRSEHSRSEAKKVELQKAVRQMYSQKKDKSGISRDRIAKRAAFLWDIDGRQDDRDEYYWVTAERQLRREANLVTGPLVKVERKLEAALRWFKSLAIFEIFEVVGSVGIAIAVVSFVANQDIRHEQDVFTAWQTITSASGQSGNGGRKEAIEFLVSRPWRFPWFCRRDGEYPSCIFRQPAESLAGLDVGLEDNSDKQQPGARAFLSGLQLPDSILARANLQDAFLGDANLQDAFLWSANLQDAFLVDANLQDTNFLGTRYTTEENSSEEICTEIFKESNPELGDEEIQTAFDNGDVYPCPTIWEGAVYNDYTVEHFPDPNFDFETAGMIHIDDLSPEELCEYSWYRRENDC